MSLTSAVRVTVAGMPKRAPSTGEDKLTPEDRWAVVAYVRALQKTQTGTLDEVPAKNRPELGLK